MSTIRRTDSAAPDLADIARQSLEEAAVIAECFGLDRAIARFDVDMMCAAYWAVNELREAGRAELRRQDRRRRFQVVKGQAG
jgi:hypothetical protein